MQKILFIDRDGVILVEPPHDYQVDSFEKLKLVPGVISALKRITQLGEYTLVMVTNQDGLGTPSFPEDTFWGPHNLMLEILAGEGIRFEDVFIDRSFPHENKNTRKPGTAMLTKYTEGPYDLRNSFVIGDRYTDMLLAQNLGARGIMIGQSEDTTENASALERLEATSSIALQVQSWSEIERYIIGLPRRVHHTRHTKETKIEVDINLEGSGHGRISTGLAFFDHMLDQLVRHGSIDLVLEVDGDLQVDEHHTIEDTGLALGEAFRKALGAKRGIERYGFVLPMDETEAHVSIDFGGRPWLVWDAEFRREKVGDMPTEMFEHFFKSFSDAALCNLNIRVRGRNEHHKIEAIFKAWAKAIKQAVARDTKRLELPSTKGAL